MTKLKNRRVYKVKEFVLSDGLTYTARQVAEKYKVKLSTTRTRLSTGVRDIEVLSRTPFENKTRTHPGYILEMSVKDRVATRNFNCPMSRLLLSTLV